MFNISKETNGKVKEFISYKDLSLKLDGVDLRTLQTTTDFPKAINNGSDILFPIEEVKKFFNIEDIEEPFITLKEAAKFLNIRDSYMHNKAMNGEVPSYRLKFKKGSYYLFRKSDLEIEKTPLSLDRDPSFINYWTCYHKLIDIFLYYIDHIASNEFNQLEMQIIKLHFQEKLPLEQIAHSTNKSREHIRMLLQKIIFKIKSNVLRLSKNPYARVLKENHILSRRVDMLEQQIKNIKHGNVAESIRLNAKLYEDIIKKMNTPLNNTELSVRAYGQLGYNGIEYTWQLIKIKYNHDKKYPNGIHSLNKIRNLGKRSIMEIIHFLNGIEVYMQPQIDFTQFWDTEQYEEIRKLLITQESGS